MQLHMLEEDQHVNLVKKKNSLVILRYTERRP